jgi:hypothetical protein
MARWTGLDVVLGPALGAFNVLLLCAELPRLRSFYSERGIGTDVLSETFSDVALWCRRHLALQGRWGLEEMKWLHHHLRGELFRLGRLQYMHISFPWQLHAFSEQGSSARVVALAGSGVRVRADGLVDGTNGIEDSEAWTSELVEEEQAWRGSPVMPSGIVAAAVVRLDRARWVPILSPGSGVLDIHIPEGEGLDPDACRASLLRARRFFRRHFPEKPWECFHSCTWLLDPQVAALLAPGSRIAGFQAGFYLLPVRSDEGQCYERVFGSRSADPSALPQDTGLKKAIAAHVAAGGRMRMGAGFLRAGDLDGQEATVRREATVSAIEELLDPLLPVRPDE